MSKNHSEVYMLGKAYINMKFSYPVLACQFKIIETLTEIKGINIEKASSISWMKGSQSTQVAWLLNLYHSYHYMSPDNPDFKIFLLRCHSYIAHKPYIHNICARENTSIQKPPSDQKAR